MLSLNFNFHNKKTYKRTNKQFGGYVSSVGSSSVRGIISALGKAKQFSGLASSGVKEAISAYQKTGGIKGLTSEGGISRLASSVANSVKSNPKLSLLASHLQSHLQSQTQPNLKIVSSLVEPNLKMVSSLGSSLDMKPKLLALQSPVIQKTTNQIKKPGLFSVLRALPRSATQNPNGAKSKVGISSVLKPFKSLKTQSFKYRKRF
jgi:hypothetical protein